MVRPPKTERLQGESYLYKKMRIKVNLFMDESAGGSQVQCLCTAQVCSLLIGEKTVSSPVCSGDFGAQTPRTGF